MGAQPDDRTLLNAQSLPNLEERHFPNAKRGQQSFENAIALLLLSLPKHGRL